MAEFDPPRPGLFRRAKDTALAAGVAAALGLKFYGLEKYVQWRRRRKLENQPAWNNRRSFAQLPKRKQRELIYRKRDQLRDYEGISYGPGYVPRAGRQPRRRLFGWGG